MVCALFPAFKPLALQCRVVLKVYLHKSVLLKHTTMAFRSESGGANVFIIFNPSLAQSCFNDYYCTLCSVLYSDYDGHFLQKLVKLWRDSETVTIQIQAFVFGSPSKLLFYQIIVENIIRFVYWSRSSSITINRKKSSLALL